MARSRRSSGANSVSLFGVILPTRMSPGLTSAPTRTTPSGPRLRKASSLTLGMSRVISSGPSLVSRADLEFVDVDGSVNVFLHHLFGDHDRIFEVVSVPRHERDQHIASQRKLPTIGIRAVCDDLASFHVLAFAHDGLLIYARAGV